MANTVVIGAQWGDEGKGKIVDLLSEENQVIVRFQGGSNAGHTIRCGDQVTILHLIPSGILHPGKLCLIGSGVVLDPEVFLEEVDALAARGVDVSPARLGVSRKAHLIMPYHRSLDQAREAGRGGQKIGTTGRGIGPCYEDRAARIGLRAGDLATPELVGAKVRHALAEKNALLTGLYQRPAHDVTAVTDWLLAMAPRLLPYVQNVEERIGQAMQQGERVLFEGAQGVHLDVDHGTYPYVTSSTTLAANAAAGSGIAPMALGRIIGIAKAYVTRVGMGPFPTELQDEIGTILRARGHEFGATTGRPRRCGWFDSVIMRETVRLNGLDSMALTKLDVLSALPVLKICVAYQYRGQRLEYPPQEEGALDEVTPIYEELPGFDGDISGCRHFHDLPEAARAYVRRLEELSGVPAAMISVGPERAQTIIRG